MAHFGATNSRRPRLCIGMASLEDIRRTNTASLKRRRLTYPYAHTHTGLLRLTCARPRTGMAESRMRRPLKKRSTVT